MRTAVTVVVKEMRTAVTVVVKEMQTLLRHFRVRMETEMRADWDGAVGAGYRGKARAVLMEASCGQV